MLLTDIVTSSERVAAARKRLQKIGLLADCIRRLAPAEIEIGLSYLAGSLPQGRLGVGYTVVQEALKTPAAGGPRLTLPEVDTALTRLLQTTGKGSLSERRAQLNSLFLQATRAEQDFLARLLMGQLRHMRMALRKLSGHYASFRAQTRCGGDAYGAAAHRVLFRLPAH